MYIAIDEDEFETVSHHTPCTNCGGDLGPCHGRCNGGFSINQRRRSSAEVAKIKADRERVREDKILAEAELIKLRRAARA